MVDSAGGIGGAGGNTPTRKVSNVNHAAATQRGADGVELSSDVMRLKGMDGIRIDRVMEVRKAIAAGTYLTDAKLDQALDGAIDEALGETAPSR